MIFHAFSRVLGSKDLLNALRDSEMVLVKNNVESKKQTKISDFFRSNIIDNNDAIFCDCDEDKLPHIFVKTAHLKTTLNFYDTLCRWA